MNRKYLFAKHREGNKRDQLQVLIERKPRDKEVGSIANRGECRQEDPLAESDIKGFGLRSLEQLEGVVGGKNEPKGNATNYNDCLQDERVKGSGNHGGRENLRA